MDSTSSKAAMRGRPGRAAIACGLALLASAPVADARAHAAPASSQIPASGTLDSVSLVQCLTSAQPAERSVTFAAEMTLIPSATRMSMRIELLEHAPGDGGYRPVQAPGVGVWRTADLGVKTYRHLEQFTDLSAPASYRALISFRWLGPHGRVIRHDERQSPRCTQAAPASLKPASSPRSSQLE